MNFKKLIIYLIPFLFFVLFIYQKDPSLTEDLGRHLRTGQIILQCHCVENINFFSYSQQSFPWIDHHWLSQVILYLFTSILGIDSLLFLKAILILAAFSLPYIIALKKSRTFWVVIFGISNLTLLSTRFRIRPELFSFLLISIFLYIIYQYKEKKYFPILFLLPLIELLWVNLHIYFIFGIAIYSCFLIEELVRKRLKSDKRLIFIFVLLLTSTLFNPQFINGAIIPFIIYNNYAWVVKEQISPFKYIYDSGFALPFNILLPIFVFTTESILLIFSFILTMRKDKVFYLLLSIVAIILGTTISRASAVFALFTLIPLTQNFSDLESKYINKKDDIQYIKIFLIILTSILIALYAIGLSNKLFGFGYVNYMEEAISFVQKNNIRGPIFNDISVGDYLIYRLYPQGKPFIDSRPEAYPIPFGKNYSKMITDINYFDLQAKKYKINTIILDKLDVFRAFPIALSEDKNWIPIYQDDFMIVFIKNSKNNEKVINKFALNK